MPSVLAVLGVTAMLAPATAFGAETLTLETRGVPGAAVVGPVFSAPLAAGATYYARVSGTSSIYQHGQWLTKKGFTPCGLPEERPQYPTPGVTNGVVGMDAEAVFGVPPFAYFHGFKCSATSFPFRITRYTDGGLQFAQGGGAFAHATPIGGPRDVPRADHTYTFQFTGDGERLAARWVDKPLQDNYGQYRLEILTEAECAAQNCVATAQPSQDQVVTAGAVVRPLAQSASDTGRPARSCVSRRNFQVRVRKYRGLKIRTATIYARGKAYAMVRRGLRIRSSVDLRGLPYGTFKVRIVATTTRGQRLVDTRTYRTCRVKRRS